jgi:hypothetical protein
MKFYSYKLRFVLAILWCCLLIQTSDSQSVIGIKFGKNTVQAGEVVSVFLRIEIPVSEEKAWISKDSIFVGINTLYESDSLNYEPFADLSILNYGLFTGKVNDDNILLPPLAQQETGLTRIIEDSLKVAFYNPGEFLFFGPALGGLQYSTVSRKPAVITVTLPEALAARDSLSLQPIKDIIYEPAAWTDYLPWVGGLLVLVILGVVIAYMIRRGKVAGAKTDLPDVAEIPPHEKALKALEDLRDTKYWEIAGDEEFQTAFTTVLREYAGARFKMPAGKMTTTEILQSLIIKGLSDVHVHALEEMLQMADLVKFAKASTPEDMYQLFLARAIEFIHNTKQINVR